eukprot:7943184-Pyramimonas_sp.AAC.1
MSHRSARMCDRFSVSVTSRAGSLANPLFTARGYLRGPRLENIPVLPAPDWTIMRIYPCFLRLIGPS